MIGQYLSNTNERATMFILQNILELNKATVCRSKDIDASLLEGLVKIPYHIESLVACMEH